MKNKLLTLTLSFIVATSASLIAGPAEAYIYYRSNHYYHNYENPRPGYYRGYYHSGYHNYYYCKWVKGFWRHGYWHAPQKICWFGR